MIRDYFFYLAEGAEGKEAEEEVPVYAPPEPKEWVDQGSTIEVCDEMVVDTRPKVRKQYVLKALCD